VLEHVTVPAQPPGEIKAPVSRRRRLTLTAAAVAVIGLVALYEQFRLHPRWRGPDGELLIFKAALVYVAALAMLLLFRKIASKVYHDLPEL